MCLSRRTTRVLLAACLLVVQAQVFAGSVLGCKHGPAPASGDTPAVICPYHQGGSASGGEPADRPAPGGALECQKCALHCALGVQGPTILDAEPPIRPRGADPATAPGWHVATATLDTLLRPPNALLL